MAQQSLPLRFTTINQNNGLSNNKVSSIYKDDDGFMWFGTEDGLNRYDGNNFKIFRNNNSNPKSIAGNWVNKIYKASNNELWVSSFCKGLNKFNRYSGNCSKIIKQDSTNKHAITSICHINYLQDNNGNSWLYANRILSKFNEQKNSFTPVFDADSVRKNMFIHGVVYHKGVIWCILYDTTVGYNVKQNKLMPSILSFNKAAAQSNIVEFVNDSIIFSNGWTLGCFLSNINSKKTVQLFKGGNVNQVKIITLNNEKYLWIGTNSGLYTTKWTGDIATINEKSFTHYTHNDNDINSLANNEINQIFQDELGVVWLSSNEGINKLDPVYLNIKYQKLSSKIVDSKWFNYSPGSFFIDTNSKKEVRFWFTYWYGVGTIITDTNFNILKRFKFEHHEKIPNERGASANATKVIRYGKDSMLIFCWDGIWLYDDIKDKLLKRYRFNDNDTAQPTTWIDDAVKDKEGNIWVGTYNRNLRKLNIKTEAWKIFKSGNGKLETKGNRCDKLFIDSKNRLWQSEVSYYDFARNEFIKLDIGCNSANDIVEDKAGTIWLATDYGIYKYVEKTKTFKACNVTTGLLSNKIYKFAIDADNNLWATSAFGLICINDKLQQIRNFTSKDGLTENDTEDVLYNLPNGNLFFTNYSQNDTSKYAFSVFNPKKFLAQSSTIPFHFASFQVLNKELAFENSLDSIKEINIDYKENLFSVFFKAIDFAGATNVRYRYRLTDISNDWIEIGNKENIVFTNLGYGTHYLQVQATNSVGIWMDKILQLKVIVHPPFWRTNWFIVLMSLLVGLLVFYFIRKRIRAIKAKAALQKQLADLEIKALRSQMNPHFIFNCLSSIQSTIVHGENEKATEYVDKFSLLLRTVLNQSDKASITLKEEINYLTTYLELETFRYEDFQFTIEASRVEDAAFIHVPSMLLQPFIENAIQHGLSHKQGEKYIDVLFEETEKVITVTIKDNGIGRAASKEINKNRSLSHKSLGIHNIEERLQILFKDNKPRIIFFDLDEGTKVVVEIPIVKE